MAELKQRQFETGAVRDTDEGKHDYEGFLSPLVVRAYGDYMHRHRYRPDGSMRDADNWQKGIPLDAYMKSGWRHFIDWWSYHRGYRVQDTLTDILCSILFNVSGYLHEHLKGRRNSSRVLGRVQTEATTVLSAMRQQPGPTIQPT